jgi:hypothetical protein
MCVVEQEDVAFLSLDQRQNRDVVFHSGFSNGPGDGLSKSDIDGPSRRPESTSATRTAFAQEKPLKPGTVPIGHSGKAAGRLGPGTTVAMSETQRCRRGFTQPVFITRKRSSETPRQKKDAAIMEPYRA